jgi:hypothetical protein
MPPVTLDQLIQGVARAKPAQWFAPGRRVRARGYSYTLECAPGSNFAQDFRPRYSPQRMLEMGVFSGKYINDCTGEFPREWFEGALRRGKLTPEKHTPSINEFGVRSRKSLRYWREKGWTPLHPNDKDPRGWFQWYCRYWLGRRMPEVDTIQIARWKAFRRHQGQILASYRRDPALLEMSRAQKRLHRPRQRQALLQWSYDPYV